MHKTSLKNHISSVKKYFSLNIFSEYEAVIITKAKLSLEVINQIISVFYFFLITLQHWRRVERKKKESIMVMATKKKKKK